MENTPPPADNRPEWLRQLTEKSWNLELVISGAAIFLVSYLPNQVDDMLRYYLENLVLDEDIKKIMLPLLVYSFMKVVAWLLILTFLSHFVLRAFWAGVVGLHAVYVDGIRYEHLPWQNKFAQEQSRANFGTLADYIARLDRLCNQVFSIAFLIALLSIGIALAYMVFFFILHILPVIVDDQAAGRRWGGILIVAVLSIAFLPMLSQLAMRFPALAERPWVQRIAAWGIRNAGAFVMPLVFRPISYLNLAYTTNVSKRRLLAAMAVGMTLFMVCVFINLLTVSLHLAGRNEISTRDFFAKGRNEYTLTGGQYDNMRSPHDRLPPISIPSEQVEGAFLRVFLDYPKMLDAALARHCATPSVPDSLPSRIRNQRKDSAHIRCMRDFFRLHVNDSLVSDPGWMFHQHPVTGTPGVVAYLPAVLFKTGKNQLLVEVPSSANPDSLRVYGQLPFWYAPK